MNKPLEVWLVDDDASIRWVLERALGQAGMTRAILRPCGGRARGARGARDRTC